MARIAEAGGADIIDIARDEYGPAFAMPVDSLDAAPVADAGARVGKHYVRLIVEDRIGVLADPPARQQHMRMAQSGELRAHGLFGLGDIEPFDLAARRHQRAQATFAEFEDAMQHQAFVLADPVVRRGAGLAAAGRLGAPMIGVRSGGFADAELREAGAIDVVDDDGNRAISVAEIRDAERLNGDQAPAILNGGNN